MQQWDELIMGSRAETGRAEFGLGLMLQADVWLTLACLPDLLSYLRVFNQFIKTGIMNVYFALTFTVWLNIVRVPLLCVPYSVRNILDTL